MRITALKQSLAAVVGSMDGILQVAADDDNRELTAEEQVQFDKYSAEAEKLQASIKREEGMLALKASAAKPIDLPQSQQPRVPAQPGAKLEKGVIVGRIALAIAAVGGGDQRALAAHAQELWGDETGQIVANMQQSTGANGGYLVDTTYSKDFVEFLRPRVVIRRMGAQSVPMPEGNLTMRKQTGTSSAGYVGERVPAPTTDMQVGNLNMTAKKLMALVPITNQLLRRASMDVDMLVRNDLVSSAAVKEDQQFIRGVGSATGPTGLRSLINGGNVIPATAGAPDLVTVTSDMAKIKLAVINANVPMIQCGYIMSPTTATFLENLRDANGNKAFPEVAEGRFGIYPIGMSTSIPDNLGVGGNESEIYFGDFSQFLIGDTYQVTLAASSEAAYDDGGVIRAAFSNDETVVRLIQEHDTQLRYDKSFAVLTAVIWKP